MTSLLSTEFVPLADAGGIEPVAPLLSAHQYARWGADRAKYEPVLVLVREGPTVVAAALTSRRAQTNSVKIVDLIGEPGSGAVAAVLDAVVSSAREQGLSSVKWELHDAGQWALAEPAGFVRLAPPIESGAGTNGPDAAILRFSGARPSLPRYYKQTTDFTCGAVALSAGLAQRGTPVLDGPNQADRRTAELSLWRTATNFPACEPVGLGVAAQAAIEFMGAPTPTPVEIYLDADGAVLLESFTSETEKEYRSLLQAESLSDAARLGVPVHRQRLQPAEILRRVEAGSVVLVLITLMPFHQYDTPHWVAAVGTDGDTLLVNDPWVDDEAGETWVDGYEIPLTLEQLDIVATWGASDYRGLVVLPAP